MPGIAGRKGKPAYPQYRKLFYTSLLTSGRLNGYLAELNKEAEDMLSRLVKQLAEKEGMTEALKAEDGMKWVQAMNNIRSRAAGAVYNGYLPYREFPLSADGGFPFWRAARKSWSRKQRQREELFCEPS